MIRKIKTLLFENRGVRQTIAKNAVWLGTGESLGRVLRAGVIIYAARVLGSSGFGVFSYAVELAGFFSIFADFGLVNILTREMARNPKRRSAYFATACVIKGVLLVVTFLLIILAAPLASKIEGARTLLPLVALMTVFEGVRRFTGGVFRASQKMELEALLVILTNIMIAVFSIVALIYTASVVGLTAGYMGGAFVGAVSAVLVLRKDFSEVGKNFDSELVRPILSSAWPLVLMGALNPFMFNADIIMIGWWHGPGAVGLYAASQRIIQLLYIVPGIVAISMLPPISRLVEEKNTERVKSLSEQSMAYVFLLIIPSAIGGIILAEPIIRLIFGSDFIMAVPAFQILMIGTLLVFPGRLTANIAFAYNREKRLALYIAFGVVGNILFNFILIPRFGIVGSAIATLGAFLLSRIPLWFFVRKMTGFRIVSRLGKIFIATFCMGILTFGMNIGGVGVIVNIVISIFIYIIALLLLQEQSVRQLFVVFNRIKKEK